MDKSNDRKHNTSDNNNNKALFKKKKKDTNNRTSLGDYLERLKELFRRLKT